MTLLYLWMESGRKRVMNFCSNDNVDLGIDMQYKTDQENSRYLVKDRIERIVFRKGRPFYINKENAALIPAFVIHAQGDAKRYMGMLSKGRNSSIERKTIDFCERVKSVTQKILCYSRSIIN
ncbi:MAG: hypothetical protein IJ600_10765 [Lachnospiraceae bacterium]|nr:hypothetical protein [Lachnospiraceae bacterium]